MNLIEQLGGYEKVSEDFKKLHLNLKEQQKSNKVFMDAFDALKTELLEYRREHNIFEVGDFIFHPMFGALFEIKRIAEKYVVASTKSGYETNLLIELISHATDAEIAAGKRLEVNDGSWLKPMDA